MAKKIKFVHGFVILDKVEQTEEYRELLSQLMKEYLMEFSYISAINDRELYYVVLRDANRIEDREVEIENGSTITQIGLLTVMTSRNPEVLGVWDIEGTPLGQTKNITPATYDEEGEQLMEEIITYDGSPTYPFNKSLYMPYMADINTYDEEGNILTSTRPTEPKPIRLFSGFQPPKME